MSRSLPENVSASRQISVTYPCSRPEVKCGADVAGRLVTIVEVRPAWDGAGANIREVVARLRYTETTGLWSIYWCDHNSEFHEYKRKRPTRNAQALLDYIGSHEDPIFWG